MLINDKSLPRNVTMVNPRTLSDGQNCLLQSLPINGPHLLLIQSRGRRGKVKGDFLVLCIEFFTEDVIKQTECKCRQLLYLLE